MSLQVKEVLHHSTSKFQDILVFDSTHHGRVLVLDGVIQVTQRDEFAYQECMAHIPLCAHIAPKKVLVIGGGDGGVVREVLKHGNVQQVVLCEIDEGVIQVAKEYFPEMACGLEDARVEVVVADGAVYLENHPDAFDVIITDSSDPVGPASVLFETPFYKAMARSLKPDGIVCTQGECVWLHLDLIRPLMQGIQSLFETVEYAYCTIPTYPSGQIGFVLGRKGPTTISKAVSPLPDEVLKKLRYYSPEIHPAAFVLPAFAKRAIFGGEE